MKDSARIKDAGQNGQCNDQNKTSHGQFKFFTGNYSHSKSLDKDSIKCFTVP